MPDERTPEQEGHHTPYDVGRGVVRAEAKADDALAGVENLDPRVGWLEGEIRLGPGPHRKRGYESKVGVMWDDYRDRAAQRRLLLGVASFVGVAGVVQLIAAGILLLGGGG